MRRFICGSLAFASVLAAGEGARASRPRYGGTLAVATAGTIASAAALVTPAESAESGVASRLAGLVFETLVAADESGGIRPLLATAWQKDAGSARWRFRLRADVVMHDGVLLDAARAAAALRATEARWTITIDGDSLVVGLPAERADFLGELAAARHAIAVRTASGAPIGSGPFQIERVDAGRLVLRAHDGYWGGRPFVDRVDVQMGRMPADQRADLEAGRVDLASIQLTDVRRIVQRGLRVVATRPLDVYVLAFEPHRAGSATESSRHALSAAIDRAAMCAVLLQNYCEPAASLLPAWITGYAPLFAERKSPAPRNRVPQPTGEKGLTLRVDPADPLAQTIADRIAVDAREAGWSIAIQAPSGLAPRADLRLLRVRIVAAAAQRSLDAAVDALGARLVALAAADLPASSPSIDVVYPRERALLEHAVIVPVVRVPDVYGVGELVETSRGPLVGPDGAWNLADVWKRPRP